MTPCIKFLSLGLMSLLLTVCSQNQEDEPVNQIDPNADKGTQNHQTTEPTSEQEIYADVPATEPQPIAGGYLVPANYENARNRCDFQNTADASSYLVACEVIALQEDGRELVATGIAKGTELAWQTPQLVSGDAAIKPCEITENKLRMTCPVTLADSFASLSLTFEVSRDQIEKRTEKQIVLLPYAVETIGGTVAGLNINYETRKELSLDAYSLSGEQTTSTGSERSLIHERGLERKTSPDYSFNLMNDNGLEKFNLHDLLNLDVLQTVGRPPLEQDWGSASGLCQIKNSLYVLSGSYIFRVDLQQDETHLSLWAGSPQKNHSNDYSHRLRIRLENDAFWNRLTCTDNEILLAEFRRHHDKSDLYRVLAFQTEGSVKKIWENDLQTQKVLVNAQAATQVSPTGEVYYLSEQADKIVLMKTSLLDNTSTKIADVSEFDASLSANEVYVYRSALSPQGHYLVARHILNEDSLETRECQLIEIQANGSKAIWANAPACTDTASSATQDSLPIASSGAIYKLAYGQQSVYVGFRLRLDEYSTSGSLKNSHDITVVAPWHQDIEALPYGNDDDVFQRDDVYRTASLYINPDQELWYYQMNGIFIPNGPNLKRLLGKSVAEREAHRRIEEELTGFNVIDPTDGSLFHVSSPLIFHRANNDVITPYYGKDHDSWSPQIEYKDADLFSPIYLAFAKTADGRQWFSAALIDPGFGDILGGEFWVRDTMGQATVIQAEFDYGDLPIEFATDKNGTLYSLISNPVTKSSKIQIHASNGQASTYLTDSDTIIGMQSDGDAIYYATSRQIKKREANGAITIIAGDLSATDSISRGDGAAATAAYLNEPRKLAFDKRGNLYIGSKDRIRWIDRSTGKIATLFGGQDQANECAFGSIQDQSAVENLERDLKASLSFICAGEIRDLDIHDQCDRENQPMLQIYIQQVIHHQAVQLRITRSCS